MPFFPPFLRFFAIFRQRNIKRGLALARTPAKSVAEPFARFATPPAQASAGGRRKFETAAQTSSVAVPAPRSLLLRVFGGMLQLMGELPGIACRSTLTMTVTVALSSRPATYVAAKISRRTWAWSLLFAIFL
jgi:hypothetical protein